ncbi:hypothetical protein ACFSKL_20685 [Belliella marina]|uniref:Viral A-type inclusion protein n=1 Tax=Belliella marina TaxID=1644146 RepID=A0ABW4VV62_9BACT
MMRFDFKIVSVFFFLCLAFSCGGEKVDQNQLLQDEVIAIHDEVMPHMGELKSLRKKIDTKANDLESVDPEGNSEKIIELRLLAKQLDEAFEGMFVWMRQYDSSFEGMSDEEKTTYLKEQKIKVTKVNDDIANSMSKANKELEEN